MGDWSATTRGRVPFQVDFEEDPPTISGRGSVVTSRRGQHPGCTATSSQSVQFELEGSLEEHADGEGQLLFEFAESEQPYVSTMLCEWPLPSPITTQHRGAPRYEYEGRLTVLDGEQLVWPVIEHSGEKKLILHVPCTQEP